MKILSGGTDIKLLGGFFLIVGMVDAIIIVLFPDYALKVFGTIVTGPASLLIKLHSPLVYLLIGYGFVFLRPWGWGLAVAYSGFGLVSVTMNQWSFGASPIRSVFMVAIILFASYLIWRRHEFIDEQPGEKSAKSVSQGSH
ncbi:MAG: conserved rane protein of unknown function [Nitrospira sp.]|nr:conserved rane protein of unknown function [Nitrospira sp.]